MSKADQAVFFWPMAPLGQMTEAAQTELKTWNAFLKAYRAGLGPGGRPTIEPFASECQKYLYQLYADRGSVYASPSI